MVAMKRKFKDGDPVRMNGRPDHDVGKFYYGSEIEARGARVIYIDGTQSSWFGPIVEFEWRFSLMPETEYDKIVERYEEEMLYRKLTEEFNPNGFKFD